MQELCFFCSNWTSTKNCSLFHGYGQTTPEPGWTQLEFLTPWSLSLLDPVLLYSILSLTDYRPSRSRWLSGRAFSLSHRTIRAAFLTAWTIFPGPRPNIIRQENTHNQPYVQEQFEADTKDRQPDLPPRSRVTSLEERLFNSKVAITLCGPKKMRIFAWLNEKMISNKLWEQTSLCISKFHLGPVFWHSRSRYHLQLKPQMSTESCSSCSTLLHFLSISLLMCLGKEAEDGQRSMWQTWSFNFLALANSAPAAI